MKVYKFHSPQQQRLLTLLSATPFDVDDDLPGNNIDRVDYSRYSHLQLPQKYLNIRRAHCTGSVGPPGRYSVWLTQPSDQNNICDPYWRYYHGICLTNLPDT